MYMVTTAANTNHRLLSKEAWKAKAAPSKRVSTARGTSSSARMACQWRSMACTASPSATPWAGLKDKVTAGNCATCKMLSKAARSSTLATLLKGTCVPLTDGTRRSDKAAGPMRSWSCTSSTTRYWLLWVKMVDTKRWPNALYSALSMAKTVTPNRAAASRSMRT